MLSEQTIVNLLRDGSINLADIEKQTLPMIRAAMRYDAVRSFPVAQIHDEQICVLAVTKRSTFYHHCQVKSEAVQMAFIKNSNGFAISAIENPSDAVKMAAVSSNSGAILLIDNPTKEMIMNAVEDSWLIPKLQHLMDDDMITKTITEHKHHHHKFNRIPQEAAFIIIERESSDFAYIRHKISSDTHAALMLKYPKLTAYLYDEDTVITLNNNQ